MQQVEPTISIRDAARSAWDVIVIGAGPAGSISAYELARSGLRVLMLDRSAHPRPKVCGCCLAPAGVQALRNLDLERVLDGADSLSSMTVHHGDLTLSLPLRGHAVLDRETLDSRLAIAAQRAGAHCLWPVAARVTTDERVALSAEVDAVRLSANTIVVADGLNGSSLRQLPQFKRVQSTQSYQGVSTQIKQAPISLACGELKMFISRVGYLGMVHLPGHLQDGDLIEVAAAVSNRHLKQAGGPAALAAEILMQAGGESTQEIMQTRWSGSEAATLARQ